MADRLFGVGGCSTDERRPQAVEVLGCRISSAGLLGAADPHFAEYQGFTLGEFVYVPVVRSLRGATEE